jgi:hypothetical protein
MGIKNPFKEKEEEYLLKEWEKMYDFIVTLAKEGITANEMIGKSKNSKNPNSHRKADYKKIIRWIDRNNPYEDPKRFTNTTNFKSYLLEMCTELGRIPPKIPTKRSKRNFMLQQIEGRDNGLRKVCLLPQMVFDHLGMGDFDEQNIRTEDRRSKENYYIKMEMKKKSKKVVVELTKATEDDVVDYKRITGKELF